MSTIFIVLMALAMVAVLAVMGLGMFSMAKGGEFNKKYSNKLMQARVMLQGFALLMFALAIVSSQT